jgi:hypothetical protein
VIYENEWQDAGAVECAKTVTAVLVEVATHSYGGGPHRALGAIFKVCLDTEKCKTHNKRERGSRGDGGSYSQNTVEVVG